MSKVCRIIFTMCCFLWWSSTLPILAQGDYDPTNPPEPNVIDFCRINVSADPIEGAYVSGSGKYKATGGNVYISTSAKNTEDYTYVFKNWSLNGEYYTSNRDFYYKTQKGEMNFVAHYEKQEVVYDPSNPREPSASTVKRKYMLYITSNIENSCTFNIESGEKQVEGTSIYLRVYPSAYYRFDGWVINGETVSTSNYYYLTMPSENTIVEAMLTELPYDPESPIDPPSSGQGNIDNTDPSRQFVILTVGTEDNKEIDKTRVVINESKSISYESDCDASKFLSSDAQCQIYTINDGVRYQINERPADDGHITVGFVAKAEGTYTISASRMDCDAILYDKILKTEHNLLLGGYTFTSAAGTIESRFEVIVPTKIILGDANGDRKVSISDFSAIVSYIMEATPVNFVARAADVNEDGNISVSDLSGLVNIILHEETTSAKSMGTAPVLSAAMRLSDVRMSHDKESKVNVYISSTVAMDGFQFDISLPEGVKVKDVTISDSRMKHPEMVSVNSGTLSDGRTRILCASTNRHTFTGTAGMVATLTLEADSSMPDGSYEATISNVEISAQGKAVKASDSSFGIKMDSATGINSIGSDEKSDAIYTVSGVKMSEAKQLPKGLYLKGGKKVAVSK